jgi:MerR family transcriptional regulator/heat shock protein HspR
MNEFDKPQFLISNVAEMLNIHPQTLRQYEREGLITPSRTNGKIRLYSRSDVEEIKYILTLTRDLGVNLAGVNIILQMNRKINELEGEINSYKTKIKDSNKDGVVPSNKALVIKKSSYSIVISK